MGGAKVKSLLHVQMRGIYSQGWNWPLWPFDFPHDYLTYMNLQLYMTLHLYMWVSWTSTLHYINCNSMAHSSDVAEMTHDMIRHDNVGMFKLLVVSMSRCSAAEWWVWSWCIIASPSHGKVCEVFDALGVRLIVHACTCVSFACYLVRFVCSKTNQTTPTC